MNFARRAAHDGEVLARQMYGAAIDRGDAGDDSIGRKFFVGHAEVGGAVLGKKANLLKAAAIHQLLNAFPGREFAGRVLPCDAIFSATLLIFCALGAKIVELSVFTLPRSRSTTSVAIVYSYSVRKLSFGHAAVIVQTANPRVSFPIGQFPHDNLFVQPLLRSVPFS